MNDAEFYFNFSAIRQKALSAYHIRRREHFDKFENNFGSLKKIFLFFCHIFPLSNDLLNEGIAEPSHLHYNLN